MADFPGTGGDDELVGTEEADFFNGMEGNDTITGLGGDDGVGQNVSTDGADEVDLGAGSDVAFITADSATNVRLTFTSAEVGNGNPNDSNSMMNQDGGLAVRLQAEDGMDMLTGPVSRYDDEGITFVGGTGVTFDVRDLVSGVQRGQLFEVVRLGTMGFDFLTANAAPSRPYYFNAGMGNDEVFGGDADDFLVGGAGQDRLEGGRGNDRYIGGGGNDDISDLFGGDDIAIFNVTTDGADRTNLGVGSDVVNVASATPGQIRLTFTSAEVGNGGGSDSNSMMNQDGGLAVRLQAEDGSDGLTGPVSRFDDEGIVFVGGAGVTFDVRDLVSGVQRGDQFEIVTLGTMGGDTLTAIAPNRPYYFNAGMGDDSITGGLANDFLVGGAGNDMLEGAEGDDSHIGGGGRDRFMFSLSGETGQDTIIDFMRVDLLVTDAMIRDGNGDGIINFGANGLLNLDRNGNDTVAFGGMAPATALRYLGQLPDGDYAYADAATRTAGAIEGRLGDSMLMGGEGEQVFFFDTALGLDFGNDTLTGFGTEDLIVTTSAIVDTDGDGRIDFGSDRRLDLADGTSVRINDGAVRSLEFDGTVVQGSSTYYVYSRVGSSETGTDDLFA